jgi:hypothetical protein
MVKFDAYSKSPSPVSSRLQRIVAVISRGAGEEYVATATALFVLSDKYAALAPSTSHLYVVVIIVAGTKACRLATSLLSELYERTYVSDKILVIIDDAARIATSEVALIAPLHVA